MEIFWKKMLFWKKSKKPELGIDYDFHYFINSDFTGITILTGKFRGVTYYYGKVSLLEQMEFANLKFEYKVIETGDYTEEYLNSSHEFVTMIGDILTEILISEEARHEQTRKNDSEEFDLQ